MTLKRPAPCPRGHNCCDDIDPNHDHFLRPVDCPRCAESRTEKQMADKRSASSAQGGPTGHPMTDLLIEHGLVTGDPDA